VDDSPTANERLCGVMGETSDPACYIARPASEAALAALESGVLGDSRCASLIGPPGMGKTMLLHVLAARLRSSSRTTLYLPYAAMSLCELCGWAIGVIRGEAPAEGRATPGELATCGGWPACELVLMIDDANSMPLEAARDLGEAVSRLGSGLRVVFAAPDDARTSRMIAAFGAKAGTCRYTQPLSSDETSVHIDGQLERVAAGPDVYRRFDQDTVDRIHRMSGGIPRLIHHLAADVLSGRSRWPAWAVLASGELSPDALLESVDRALEDPGDDLG